MNAAPDMDGLHGWIGRTEVSDDVLTPFPVAGLAALFDRGHVPAELPPLWHWLYFKPVVTQAQIDTDGHPTRGGFLPPVPLPRRMWAGSRLRFFKALPVGATLRRDSVIRDLVLKHGRQGDLVLLSLQHRFSIGAEVVLEEDQDIVYRALPPPGAPVPSPAAAVPRAARVTDAWLPDPVQLFRYSALTFNGHRIHYDRPYAESVEGYPGLIVQGPLTASLLLERFTPHLDAPLCGFEFRAVSPLIAGQPVHLGLSQQAPGVYELWAATADGRVAMSAKARTQAAA